MRWMRASLPLVAVVLLVGCARNSDAAPRTTENPWAAPKPSASSTPSQQDTPPASWSPVSPSPTPKKATSCGEIPTQDRRWYWREEAVPPATCAQAKSVLPTAVLHREAGKDSTVSGWSCVWEKVPPFDQVTGSVFCTKGSRTIRAVYLHRK